MTSRNSPLVGWRMVAKRRAFRFLSYYGTVKRAGLAKALEIDNVTRNAIGSFVGFTIVLSVFIPAVVIRSQAEIRLDKLTAEALLSAK
jgi:hypothetical protein